MYAYNLHSSTKFAHTCPIKIIVKLDTLMYPKAGHDKHKVRDVSCNSTVNLYICIVMIRVSTVE